MRLIGLLALLAYAFVGTNSAGMWCFGSDGHVAYEQVGAEHPLVSDSAAIGASGAVIVAGGGMRQAMPHGPCFDVALDASSQWHAAAKADGARVSAPPIPATPAAPAIAAPPRLTASGDLVARGDGVADPRLATLRSTVLRI